jgi:hypothetical protein
VPTLDAEASVGYNGRSWGAKTAGRTAASSTGLHIALSTGGSLPNVSSVDGPACQMKYLYYTGGRLPHRRPSERLLEQILMTVGIHCAVSRIPGIHNRRRCRKSITKVRMKLHAASAVLRSESNACATP